MDNGKQRMVCSISFYDIRYSQWNAIYVYRALRDPDKTGLYDQMVRIWLRAWYELHTDQYHLFNAILH